MGIHFLAPLSDNSIWSEMSGKTIEHTRAKRHSAVFSANYHQIQLKRFPVNVSTVWLWVFPVSHLKCLPRAMSSPQQNLVPLNIWWRLCVMQFKMINVFTDLSLENQTWWQAWNWCIFGWEIRGFPSLIPQNPQEIHGFQWNPHLPLRHQQANIEMPLALKGNPCIFV